MTGAGRPGYWNNRIVHDRIWQYHGELSKDLNGSFLSNIAVGGNWTNHVKSLTPDEAIVQLADGVTQLALPDQYNLGSADFSWIGLGNTLAYNPQQLLDAGIYNLVSNNSNPDVEIKGYHITEKLGTLYALANINADLGSARLTGNVGVQAVHTDQSSSGNNVDRATGALTPVTNGAKYWDVMPSLNLSLRFPSDFVIRMGLAREVMRPRIDDMRQAFRYGGNRLTVQTSPGVFVNENFISGDAGNPELRPFRANAADLSFEKYWGLKGYISAQFFYKYFDTFVVDQNLFGVPFDYTGFPIPTGYQTTDPTNLVTYLPPEGINGTNSILTRPYNVKGGKMYGVELAGTLPFGELISALDGFGVTGGVSYTKSRIRPYFNANGTPGSATDLPGYSKWVANGTLYFEKWGFSARGSVRYRSSLPGRSVGLRRQPHPPPSAAADDCRWADRLRVPAGFDAQWLVGLSASAKPDERAVPDRRRIAEPAAHPRLPAVRPPLDARSDLQVRRLLLRLRRLRRQWLLRRRRQLAPPATQTCPDGSVILATDTCPAPPPPPPPPAPAPERGY